MNIYREAQQIQNACNLSGLIISWARAMETIRVEAQAANKGTEWINTHPVNVLFAEQAYHLTGNGALYSESYKETFTRMNKPDTTDATGKRAWRAPS